MFESGAGRETHETYRPRAFALLGAKFDRRGKRRLVASRGAHGDIDANISPDIGRQNHNPLKSRRSIRRARKDDGRKPGDGCEAGVVGGVLERHGDGLAGRRGRGRNVEQQIRVPTHPLRRRRKQVNRT